MIVRGTLSYIAKAQRIPDMTTVHDKLNAMHTEQNRTAKDTAKDLVSVKEELNNNTASVQEGITAAKQAGAAAQLLDQGIIAAWKAHYKRE
jgi:hypothetical protein